VTARVFWRLESSFAIVTQAGGKVNNAK